MNAIQKALACSAAAALCLAACATTPPKAQTVAATPGNSAALAQLFDDYFEDLLRRNPLLATSIGDERYNDQLGIAISPAARAAEERSAREFLRRVDALGTAGLSASEITSRNIFRAARVRDIEGFRFPSWLLPVNQFGGMPITFVQLGSGSGPHPFKRRKDYDDFLKRSTAFGSWVDQAIANMREGMTRHVVQPRVLMERVLPQLDAQLVDEPTRSNFWGPIERMPASFSEQDRSELTAAWRQMIQQQVVPNYRRLRDFIRDEYLPACRDSVGLAALPDGAAWYAFNVKSITTTALTPAQIHAMGLAEVARIHGEMEKVMQQVGFKGDLHAFFDYVQKDDRFYYTSREDLIAGYRDIQRRVDPQLPRLFERLPKAGYEVRAVEPFREKSAAGGQYQAASEDGSRPGIFYANAYDLRARPKWAMESLSLHEANPGHHFQISLQREQQGLPRFRRFGGYTAFIEGWGLYAESLGPELGMYQDPYQYFGMLQAELWRAVRLVVDTGLHSKGWSRQQVLDYMAANSAAAEAQRVSEAERYIAIPGQALAYKVGQMKIRELRSRAEQALGAKFDVRKFHTQVLEDGAMPLDVLEAKIDGWIAAQR